MRAEFREAESLKSFRSLWARSVLDVQAPSEPLHLAVCLEPKLPGGGAADSAGPVRVVPAACSVGT